MRQAAEPNVMFAVSAWCVAYAIEHGGNSPSMREIADNFGVYPRAVQVSVERMFRYGVARRDDSKLIIVGSQYLPPQWYIDNVHPALSKEDLTDSAWRNSRRTRILVPR